MENTLTRQRMTKNLNTTHSGLTSASLPHSGGSTLWWIFSRIQENDSEFCVSREFLYHFLFD